MPSIDIGSASQTQNRVYPVASALLGGTAALAVMAAFPIVGVTAAALGWVGVCVNHSLDTPAAVARRHPEWTERRRRASLVVRETFTAPLAVLSLLVIPALALLVGAGTVIWLAGRHARRMATTHPVSHRIRPVEISNPPLTAAPTLG